jgi:hypothetical protein
VELNAYERHVFLDWREVQDNEWHQYAHLTSYLNGRGVPSIEEALREVFLQPVHYPFKELANAGMLRWLMDNRVTEPVGAIVPSPLQAVLDKVERKALHLLHEIKQFTGGAGDEAAIAQEIRRKLEASLCLPILADRFPLPGSRKYQAAAKSLQAHLGEDVSAWGSLFGWLFIHALGRVVVEEGFQQQSRSWMDEWLLSKLVAGALRDLGLDEGAAWWAVGVVKILISHQRWFEIEAPKAERAYQILVSWLRDGEVQQFAQVNRYRGVLWFNKEAFDQLLGWMLTVAAVEISADPDRPAEEVAREIVGCYDVVKKVQQAEEGSGYQVVKLMEAVKR